MTPHKKKNMMPEEDVIEELCVALERTSVIAKETMFTALLKESPISRQLDKNLEVIEEAIALVSCKEP